MINWGAEIMSSLKENSGIGAKWFIFYRAAPPPLIRVSFLIGQKAFACLSGQK